MYSCLFTFPPHTALVPHHHHHQQLASRHQIPVKGGYIALPAAAGDTINSNVDNKKIGPVAASLTSDFSSGLR